MVAVVVVVGVGVVVVVAVGVGVGVAVVVGVVVVVRLTTTCPISGQKGEMNTTWDEIERSRMRREDEGVARKWAAYAHLGRGWLPKAGRPVLPDEEYNY